MDIRGQYEQLLPDIKRLVGEVIDSGRFILGPNVRALEEEVAAAVGYGHAVAMANGTDALELGLQALGIGPGDEVVTSAYTFFATAEAIARRAQRPSSRTSTPSRCASTRRPPRPRSQTARAP
jgi:dTDP-4-amino-4,6-dideoxygalactose transaminase